jgi:pyruvate dehydrogenase E2 component (dihydrolipoamide acetyltransferase)
MAFEFKFPDVGEGIHEGKIVKWLVKEGDEVKTDQALAEVETDKAIVEIPAPQAGKIIKITHAEGDTIKVGEVLATFEGSAASAAPSSPKEEEPEKKESTGVIGELEATAAGVMKAPSMEQSGAVFGQSKAKSDAKTTHKPAAKPAAKSAPAKESKGHGVVKKEFKQVKKFDFFGYIDRVPYDGIRKTIGDHMVKSVYTIPHVTHTDFADVTDLVTLRQKEKVKAEKEGIKLTYLAYITKAIVAGLQNHPFLNATLDEEEGVIIQKKYYNIGIAVDTEAGLMVPVVKGADQKPVLQIAKEIEELAQKARDRKLNAMDMKGGTFTITNIGSAKSGWFATPVINYPESAILGVGMIQEMGRPVNGKLEIRSMLPLSVAFDHRVLDGAEAARFTNTLKEHLENPKLLEQAKK